MKKQILIEIDTLWDLKHYSSSFGIKKLVRYKTRNKNIQWVIWVSVVHLEGGWIGDKLI